MEEVIRTINEMEWQQASNYPAGAEMKVLREGDGSHGRTILLRLPSGWQMSAHSHTAVEQHYVLEGQYESHGETLGVGSYQLIPNGVDHGPFSTESGAVILVVWDPVAA